MEVVHRGGFGALGGRWRLRVRLGRVDLVGAVPFEQHLTGGDVDLLHDPVEDLPFLRSSHRRDVPRPRLVDRDQGRVPLRDQELVDVAREAVACRHGRDRVVGVVHDLVVAVADAVDRAAAPPGQDGLPEVRLNAEVGDALRIERLVPDEPPAVVDDHQARSPDVLLRGEEDVARRRVGCGGLDLHDRRLEIRARLKVLRRGRPCGVVVLVVAAARAEADEHRCGEREDDRGAKRYLRTGRVGAQGSRRLATAGALRRARSSRRTVLDLA